MINFEDTDLGIFGLCFLALIGTIAGVWLKVEAAVMFSFLGLCGTGIAGLVRGKTRNKAELSGEPRASPEIMTE